MFTSYSITNLSKMCVGTLPHGFDRDINYSDSAISLAVASRTQRT